MFALPFVTCYLFFFFNDTATTEIYTLSLHDALPISQPASATVPGRRVTSSCWYRRRCCSQAATPSAIGRSEEHTSELQSQSNLVCRLLLEKKKKKAYTHTIGTRDPSS